MNRFARRSKLVRRAAVPCKSFFRPSVELLEGRLAPAAVVNIEDAPAGIFPQVEFVDPNPNAGGRFGYAVVALSTGNVVVTDPDDNAGGADAGAVYLFNGLTGALISTLTGSSPFDRVGLGGVTVLGNGNYVIHSRFWDNGPATNAGAVTFCNGMTGVSGAVSATNSLVGSTSEDGYLSRVTALDNGNYVVFNAHWDNGPAVDAGAVTFGSGTTGIAGAIGAANSLVGSTSNDRVGGSVITLGNGNYVVLSPYWANGAASEAGAVTFVSGTSGITGTVSAANSLVGSASTDRVGNYGVATLGNGNYVVRSPLWDNGAASDAGAATFGNGTTGITGAVSSVNSLVGSANSDLVGQGVVTLGNGNYVVVSQYWDNGAAVNAGAATFGSGTTGISGAVSAANSLVGSTSEDYVSHGGVVAVGNGNYLVCSPSWSNGAATSAGAVTFASATTGITGTISAANSLVGSATGDFVGNRGVTVLSNGNYVVLTPSWAGGAGAVTFGSGTTGITGAVSAANSLVGSGGGQVGSDGVSTLNNGNYVVVSPNWNTGAGAATFGSGTTGITGVVSAANSLVGSVTGDRVGAKGVTTLTNGNYVVVSPYWDNGAASNAGAVTFGSGTAGIAGVVSAANSLVGPASNDLVGFDGVTALANGNYVVVSPYWDNGAANSAGAATFGNGTTGVSGVVSAANSLVGSASTDLVGVNGVTALPNGNYVVLSPSWDNGAATNAGAATFGGGTTGISGPVSAANSLVGSASGDELTISAGVTVLGNGNYVVLSQRWDNGGITSAGAATWVDGTTGRTLTGFGPVTPENSIVGQTVNAGTARSSDDPMNQAFLVFSPSYNNTGRVVSGFADPNLLTYARGGSQTITVTPGFVAGSLAAGSAVTLQAANALNVVNSILGGNADLNLQSPAITLSPGVTVATGNGTARFGDGTLALGGATPGSASIAGNLSFAASLTYQVRLNGPTTGSEFDQLIATGAVNLGGAVLNVNPGYVPSLGQTFTLIDNQSGTPVVGTFAGLAEGQYTTFGGLSFQISYQGGDGNDVVLTRRDLKPFIAISPDAGAGGQVKVFDGPGSLLYTLVPYGGPVKGGIGVAVGDVNGDFTPDIITGKGSGRALIKVYDGVTGLPLAALPNGFFAYGKSFKSGVFLAVGDVFNNDGAGEIIVAPKKGAGKVKVFDGTGTVLRAFYPFGSGFAGGVRVAAGNVTGGEGDEIVALRCSAGGAAPRSSLVRIFANTGALLSAFKASDSTNNFVAAGNVDGSGFDEIVIGLSGQVKVFDGTGAVLGNTLTPYAGYQGKIRVAALDVDGDGDDDILTGTAKGHDSEVRVFDGVTLAQLDSFFAFPADYLKGVFVAGGN